MGKPEQLSETRASLLEKGIAHEFGWRITGDISTINELGPKGWEVMRLMKLGVFDVAFGVFGYVASEHPIFEGVDLSSAAKDFNQSRINANAYRKVLEREFRKFFNAKQFVIYRYTSQYMRCNKNIGSLNDMKGLKIRVYSTTLGNSRRAWEAPA